MPGMVTPENKKVERYIRGLSPQIQGHVLASNPTTLDSTKCLAQRLVDHRVRQGVITPNPELTKRDDYKRKSWSKKEGQPTQEASKRQHIVDVYTTTTPTTPTPIHLYVKTLPKCNTCTFHQYRAYQKLHC